MIKYVPLKFYDNENDIFIGCQWAIVFKIDNNMNVIILI